MRGLKRRQIGLLVCTVVVVGVSVVSMFVGFGVRWWEISGGSSGRTGSTREITIEGLSVVYSTSPHYSMVAPDPSVASEPNRGMRLIGSQRDSSESGVLFGDWWPLPERYVVEMSDAGPVTTTRVPYTLIVLVMVGWSGLILIRSERRCSGAVEGCDG